MAEKKVSAFMQPKKLSKLQGSITGFNIVSGFVSSASISSIESLTACAPRRYCAPQESDDVCCKLLMLLP